MGKPISQVLISVSLDWLTATFAASTAKVLMAETTHEKDGVAQAGFCKSERRICIGGHVWRRWEPRQSSRRYGLDYESWEWSGSEADWGACILRDHHSKPTRIDIAFDLSVSITADEFADACQEHHKGLGITHGISGQAGVNTRYVGSVTSGRRIRIYRKDLQDEAWATVYGATLRVELILKELHAVAWWGVWKQDKQAAYQAAAGHIKHMLGVDLVEDVGDVPELEPVEGLDLAGSLAALVKQYGMIILVQQEVGIDIFALATINAANASPVARSRAKAYAKQLQAAGPHLVQEMAQQIIAARH